MAKSKNKKMISFFIWLGIIGGALTLISLAGYRIYSGKSNEEKEKLATQERKVINENIADSMDTLLKEIENTDSLLIETIDIIANTESKILKKSDKFIEGLKEIKETFKKSQEASSKPVLRIGGESFGENTSIDPKYVKFKHHFGYKVTNHGGRAALELRVSCYFFEKLGNNTIGRYNVKGFDEEYTSQSDIMKGETKSFIYPFTISEKEGVEQLNSTLVMFKLEYIDALTRDNGEYKLYKRFHIDSKGIKLYLLRQEDINLVNSFMNSLERNE